MAEKVGDIYYDIEIETSQLLTANQQAKKALDELGNQTKGAAAGIKTLETQMKSSAAAVEMATKAGGGLRNTLQQAGYQVQDFIVQVQGGQSALVAFSQQGSQLAGAFGPGGAVAGAVIALGSVLTGLLMTSLGSSSNKMKELQSAAESLNKIVVINSQGVAALSNDYARLAATNAALATQLRDAAVARYAAEVENARKAISNIAEEQKSWWRNLSGGVASVTAAGNALDTLNIKSDNFGDAINQAESAGTAFRSSTQTLLSTVDMMASKFDISEQAAFTLVKQLNDLAKNPTPDNVTRISQSLATMKSTTDEGRIALANFRDELTKAGASAAQAEQAVKDLEASIGRMKTEAQEANFSSLTKGLNQQLIALKQGKQAAVEYAIAQQDLTAEQKQEAIALSRQVAAAEADAVAKKKAEKQAGSLAKAEDSVTQKLEILRQKSELSASSTGELSREQAILQAQQSLGKSATQEQIRLAGEYAAKTYDNARAVKDLSQAEQGRKFATQEITAAKVMPDAQTGAVADPMAEIDLREQQKLAALAKYQALDVQNAQLYEDAKTAIQRQAANARQQIAENEANMQSQAISSIIGSVSQGFDGLANLAAGAAGKSSGAYQAMFALSKGFAVAQAALNLQLAISQAMADPTALTPAQKFANYAAIASAGASLLTSIGSISMGGAREHGGPVNASSMYRVGEGGKPEIFKASNGSQYMIPGDNGKVISNSDLGGAGGSGSSIQQEVHFHITTTNGIDDATMNKMAGMMKQVALYQIKDQQRPGGMLRK